MSVESRIEEYLAEKKIQSQSIDDRLQKVKGRTKELDSLLDNSHLEHYLHTLSINDPQQLADEVIATVSLACKRKMGSSWDVLGKDEEWRMDPYDIQMKAGMLLCDEDETFARIRTGEGKTLISLFPIVYNSLFGNVHVFTANDYLAKRDHAWLSPILSSLGVSSSYLGLELEEKRVAYTHDVVFGSDKEFSFDYLRDSVRGLGYAPLCNQRDSAIVDEGCLVLLDELETPIILSVPVEKQRFGCELADRVMRELKNEQEKRLSEVERRLMEYSYTNEKDYFRDLLRLFYGGAEKKYRQFIGEDVELEADVEQFGVKYLHGKEFAKHVGSSLVYTVNKNEKSSLLTADGMRFVEEMEPFFEDLFDLKDLYLLERDIEESDRSPYHKRQAIKKLREDHATQRDFLSSLHNALHAHCLLEKDVDYVVQGGRVELVNKATGRSEAMKKYQNGLSQAVECKEELEAQPVDITLTSTTIKGMLKSYSHVCAMSGTIHPNQSEMRKIYDLECVDVPPRKNAQARHFDTELYVSKEEKYAAILEDILRQHAFHRPILIGTQSVKSSEELSKLLSEEGLEHHVLNAKHEEAEARIVSEAGQLNALTIATQMAGRGTDIKVPDHVNEIIAKTYVSSILSSSEDFARYVIRTSNAEDSTDIHRALEHMGAKYKWKGNTFIVKGSGQGKVGEEFTSGLYVLGAELAPSTRSNEQLRGRTGRQGSTGSSRFYTSLEDEVMQEHVDATWLGRFACSRLGRYVPFASKLAIHLAVQGSEEESQHNREENSFYGALVDEQRARHVQERERVIGGEIDVGSYIQQVVLSSFSSHQRLDTVLEELNEVFNMTIPFPEQALIDQRNAQSALQNYVTQCVNDLYAARADSFGDMHEEIQQALLLQTLDIAWVDHLEDLDLARRTSRLASYAQKDPKVAFVKEAHKVFKEYRTHVATQFCTALFHQPLPRQLEVTSASTAVSDELAELLG